MLREPGWLHCVIEHERAVVQIFKTGRGLPAEEFEKFCIQPMAGIVKRA
jgi:hypothetical protein